MSWTTAADIAAKVRRRWDDGSLLRAHAEGLPFVPIEVPLRGPRPSQVGDDIGAVREWIAALDAGRRDDSRYTLEWQSIGGRQIGRNQIPVRAVVSSLRAGLGAVGCGGDGPPVRRAVGDGGWAPAGAGLGRRQPASRARVVRRDAAA